VFRRPFAGVLLECLHVPAPGDEAAFALAFDALAETLREGADTIAAVVLEPLVQGAAGMRMYSAEALRAARRLCDAHDVFLVVDEVFTGYGRTGTLWACQQAGISPDLLCVAKGFTGGMLPMAATLATPRIFDGFLGDADRAFYYGHSFCGNPLGAAVAREVLRVFDEEKVLEGIPARATAIGHAFDAMATLRGVARTRHLGMIGALDLSEGDGYLAQAGWRVFDEARRRGAYLRPLGNTVYVAPPLNIPEGDLRELLEIVRESVAVVGRGIGR
jgi:adenosylmethionine-8-amino-7-oxononanoate aminotransferase